MIGNFYTILEIEAGVDQETVEAAYRRLALLYHPDLNRSPDATRKMQEVNEAYMTLRNPNRRSVYDRDHGIVAVSTMVRSTVSPFRETYRPQASYNPPKPSPRPTPEPESSPETQLLTFYIENSLYAFNILDVEGVTMMQPILQHLRAPVFVEGLITHRSSRIPIIDLRRHMGFPNQPTTRETRVLVVKFDGISTGLIVDSAGAPLKVMSNTIEAPHTLSDLNNPNFVKGIVRNGFQVVVILNLVSLLTREELSALKNFVG